MLSLSLSLSLSLCLSVQRTSCLSLCCVVAVSAHRTRVFPLPNGSGLPESSRGFHERHPRVTVYSSAVVVSLFTNIFPSGHRSADTIRDVETLIRCPPLHRDPILGPLLQSRQKSLRAHGNTRRPLCSNCSFVDRICLRLTWASLNAAGPGAHHSRFLSRIFTRVHARRANVASKL